MSDEAPTSARPHSKGCPALRLEVDDRMCTCGIYRSSLEAKIADLERRLAAPHPDTVPCACCVDRGGADGHCMDGCRCSSTVRK